VEEEVGHAGFVVREGMMGKGGLVRRVFRSRRRVEEGDAFVFGWFGFSSSSRLFTLLFFTFFPYCFFSVLTPHHYSNPTYLMT